VMQIGHTLQEPTGANPGILTTTFTNPYVNGATTGTMNWNEVGIIDIKLSLASFLGDTSFTSSYTAEGVGRFRPAGFRIQTGSLNNGVFDNSCGTFSYIGQDFGYLVNPAFVVEAINTANAVTTNYRGDWNKLTSGSFPISVVSNDGSNALDIVHTQAGINYNPVGNGVFNVIFGNDTFCYGLDVSGSCVKQSNAQLAEFTADITMSLATISDGEISTAIGQDFSPISGQLRYGRLEVSNVFGSELVGLTMPMRTQYFDGSNFIPNVHDSCTTVDHSLANELTVTPVLSGGTSTVTVISTTAVGGVLDISLTAPGANNIGYIDVLPDLTISGETWLQYDWDSTIPGLENPSGRANFGIYNGDSRQIYIRQIY
jgi:MSHA biogenesis protein MshQ